jgi:hypothetical protein
MVGYVVVAGMLLPTRPLLLLAGTIAVVLPAIAFLRPHVGAYIVLATTPLTAGIERGNIVPILRPHEVVLLLVGVGVLTRWLAARAAGDVAPLTFRATDAALLALVLFGSVVPVLWLVVRSRPITQDDLLYSFILPKYFALYLFFRTAVRSDSHVRTCLWVALWASAVVAVVAILQALKLFNVPELLSRYYTAYGDVEALYLNRGGSTLANPLAVADVMVICFAVAAALLLRGNRRRPLLIGLAGLFVVGCLASGQFSGALALLVGVAAIGYVTGRFWRPLALVVPALIVAGLALQPVIDRRLSAVRSSGGVPPSWEARMRNLQTYFLPDLLHEFNWVLGVRPSSRVERGVNNYVFIESGYIQLLWSGGVPLLVATIAFLSTHLRATARLTRRRRDGPGVAAAGAFTALAVVAVLDVTDPHLTLRGAGDLTFALLALAYVRPRPRVERRPEAPVRFHALSARET